MMKISTRLFAASALAAMLICLNQGAFAHEKTTKVGAKTAASCAMCVEKTGITKTAMKGAKPVVSLAGSAKISPKAAAVKPVTAKVVALKTVTVGNAKVAVEACPMCAEESKAKG